MKYILDSSGYIESASCNPISCDDKVSQEYTGAIPDGYETFDEWILNANIRAYKIVNNNLVYDEAKDAALQEEWEQTGHYNTFSDKEVIIGTWFGKPLYRKTFTIDALPNNGFNDYSIGMSNIITRDIKGCIIRDTDGLQLGFYQSTITQVQVRNYGEILRIVTTDDYSRYSGHVTLEYTKTTD